MCVSLLTITIHTVQLLIRHVPDAHIRVSREELNAANYTSIPFQDGSVCNLQNWLLLFWTSVDADFCTRAILPSLALRTSCTAW